MSTDFEILLVLTNLPDAHSAERITQAVLESRTAACVNRMPAYASSYWWNGAIEQASEIPLAIKTTRAAYPALEAMLRKLHPYEVPEIIAVSVSAGLPDYLAWVAAQTGARPADA